MWWSSSSGKVELNITKAQARDGSHAGDCTASVFALSQESKIRRQLAKLDPVEVANELREYGAWDDEELADHPANLQRLLWIACGDVSEGKQ